jgi:hypothetical protein
MPARAAVRRFPFSSVGETDFELQHPRLIVDIGVARRLTESCVAGVRDERIQIAMIEDVEHFRDPPRRSRSDRSDRSDRSKRSKRSKRSGPFGTFKVRIALPDFDVAASHQTATVVSCSRS